MLSQDVGTAGLIFNMALEVQVWTPSPYSVTGISIDSPMIANADRRQFRRNGIS